MLNLNTEILSAVPVVVPPIEQQRRIAGVLGALDEKIEHNARLSGRLADIALAQFEDRHMQWLRPGSLEELGGPAREESTHSAPYIGLEHMPRGSTILDEWAEEVDIENAVAFRRGDVLFGKLRPYFKKVGVAPLDGRCSPEILVLRPRADHLWGPLLGYISSDAFISYCVQVSRGTKMPRAEWRDASTFPVAVPDEHEGAELTREMRCLYHAAIALVCESKTLRQVRDALLPKLVSGVIRVPGSYDPDDAVGSVAEGAGVPVP
jgi:type I restriction enzyme S subunit